MVCVRMYQTHVRLFRHFFPEHWFPPMIFAAEQDCPFNGAHSGEHIWIIYGATIVCYLMMPASWYCSYTELLHISFLCVLHVIYRFLHTTPKHQSTGKGSKHTGLRLDNAMIESKVFQSSITLGVLLKNCQLSPQTAHIIISLSWFLLLWRFLEVALGCPDAACR